MSVQAWLLMTSEEKDDVIALNNPNSDHSVIPRIIDNPLANNLGEGILVGKYVAPARLLNDPDYSDFYELCSTFPIRTMDSDVLFIPYVED